MKNKSGQSKGHAPLPWCSKEVVSDRAGRPRTINNCRTRKNYRASKSMQDAPRMASIDEKQELGYGRT